MQTRVFSTKLSDSRGETPSVYSLNDAALTYALSFEDWSAALVNGHVAGEHGRPEIGNGHREESPIRDTAHACQVLESFAANVENDSRDLHAIFGRPLTAVAMVQAFGKVARINESFDQMRESGPIGGWRASAMPVLSWR